MTPGARAPIVLTVLGSPAPQGSKRAFPIRKGGILTGRVALVESSAERVRTWREDVRSAACGAMDGRPPLAGPLAAAMTFTLKKPASAPKRTRTWPEKRPDLGKLARSTEDALTGVCWLDDAQVVVYTRLAKAYPLEDEDALAGPGAVIRISPLADLFMI